MVHKIIRKPNDRFKIQKSTWLPDSWTVKDLVTGDEITASTSKKHTREYVFPQVIKAFKTKTLWFSKEYLKK